MLPRLIVLTLRNDTMSAVNDKKWVPFFQRSVRVVSDKKTRYFLRTWYFPTWTFFSYLWKSRILFCWSQYWYLRKILFSHVSFIYKKISSFTWTVMEIFNIVLITWLLHQSVCVNEVWRIHFRSGPFLSNTVTSHWRYRIILSHPANPRWVSVTPIEMIYSKKISNFLEW
jgi:hypothetical protein